MNNGDAESDISGTSVNLKGENFRSNTIPPQLRTVNGSKNPSHCRRTYCLLSKFIYLNKH